MLMALINNVKRVEVVEKSTDVTNFQGGGVWGVGKGTVRSL